MRNVMKMKEINKGFLPFFTGLELEFSKLEFHVVFILLFF